MSAQVHIFGIRHHGPGSARSLCRALDALQPDIVLLEGPADVEELHPLAANPELRPPVALLIYRPDAPHDAVFYPFADFSPEWQAIQFAIRHHTPWRFIDLPQSITLAAKSAISTEEATPSENAEKGDYSPDQLDEQDDFPRDPLRHIAEAAGYADSERWWEQHFEERRDSTDVFEAVLEMMTAVRADHECQHALSLREARREAHMRQGIRAAMKEGFQRIAVICGAWHGPALATLPTAKSDADLLRGLPKVKTAATWIPWTHGRLTMASGYGAGIGSPGYYQHLWSCEADASIRWMAKVGQFLRSHDLDASTASIIEASRLADTLAALRGRSTAGLAEFNEAARALFCFGDATPMRLIEEQLIVGETLGAVPADTPALPLQTHLRRDQKRLRLAPEASSRLLELDLRKPNDLDRSHLLHRLSLLGIPWGRRENSGTRGKGTFREEWRLAWDPDFEIRVIEANLYGNTLEQAAGQQTVERASKANDLKELTALIESLLLADLPDAVRYVTQTLENAAALTSDAAQLMAALPSLVNAFRYGSVRQLDAGMLGHVIHGLIARICIGLIPACGSLNDDAAADFLQHLNATHAAIETLDDSAERDRWADTLSKLADIPNLHGLIAGRCCRILLDRQTMEVDESQRRLSLALSAAAGVPHSAAWLDGFLSGSGLLLLHNPALWQPIHAWVANLSEERFIEILPLLRRTFSAFDLPERRQLGELAQHAPSVSSSGFTATSSAEDERLDAGRADRVMPILGMMLGIEDTPENLAPTA